MKAITVLYFCLIMYQASAQNYKPTWESIDSRQVPAWFEDAKFGIFIHWGVYSVPSYSPTKRDGVGIYDRYAEHYWRRWTDPESKTKKYFTDFHNRVYGEQISYQDFARDFNADFFLPDEWAERFKNAGAKYVVLTSKHHEGFALWPSAYSRNWNAMDVGPHRDLLGDLTKSVRDKGLRIGYYYSLLEWYHPLYKRETIGQYVEEHMIPQMKELVVNYKPDILWTDGEWDYPSETLKSTQFLSWLYNESSVRQYVVTNDRWGKETRIKHGGIYTTEYDLINNDNSSNIKFVHPWEECRGMAGSFGYNRAEELEDYSTSAELIYVLIDKVARGGNLLLNVGPTADGRIPVIMQQRLADIGEWLDINGEAIYETRAWADAPATTDQTKTFYTRKGKDLYVIATSWQNSVEVPLNKKPKRVSMLGLAKEVKFLADKNKLYIAAPVFTPDIQPCKFAWVYKLEDVF